jgi:rSAM/selenodomain-associated transferase 1
MPAQKVLDPDAPGRLPEKICALGIMTKVPQAGQVKTRLTPPLTWDEAAELNKCFLSDLARSITQACVQSRAQGVGVYTPKGAEAAYETILPAGFFLIPQRGNGFGERLILAAEDLFKAGFESVCLINSDSPTVPALSFAEAANELAKPGDRVVLGPSDDGGYYLIGLKRLHRRLFDEIDWSTERVLEQTIDRANELGATIHRLPAGYDVDDHATLQRLCQELLGPSAASVDLAPNTRRFLMEIIKREGRARIWPV